MYFLIFFPFLLFAQLDSSSQEALDKTTVLLKSKEARQEAAQKSPQAKKAYSNATKLMGSDKGEDALFGLSAEIFEYLVKSTNGDSKKMKALLQKAATNPEDFANSLPPHLKQKIKSVSKQVPKSNPRN